MSRIRDIQLRLLASIEFRVMVVLGTIWGVKVIVRYLRNPNNAVSIRLLRKFGARIGGGTSVKGSLIIDNAYGDQNSTGDFRRLIIGDNCYLGEDLYLDLANDIRIEDNAVIAGRVSLLTHSDCNRSPFLAGVFERRCEPTTIHKGAWIGFGATVLCGLSIGENAVVASGAVVSTSVPPYECHAGVPAKKIRELGTPKQE